MRHGIRAMRVHVEVTEDAHAHRHLHNILQTLAEAGLPERARRRAEAAYRALAEAEAKVHGTTAEHIHFHEVGAKDAILDVAGAMVGMELLGAQTFSSSVVTVGWGNGRVPSRLMPVPAPATAELLRGIPTAPGPWEAEMTTPTGAAILKTLLGEAMAAAPCRFEKIGYGAGSREMPGCVNALRLMLGELAEAVEQMPVPRHGILALETEIDDMSPEVAGYLMDRLLAEGALDVQFSPVQMKKNRPALRLKVLCDPAAEARLAELIFRETSTFGLRPPARRALVPGPPHRNGADPAGPGRREAWPVGRGSYQGEPRV